MNFKFRIDINKYNVELNHLEFTKRYQNYDTRIRLINLRFGKTIWRKKMNLNSR